MVEKLPKLDHKVTQNISLSMAVDHKLWLGSTGGVFWLIMIDQLSKWWASQMGWVSFNQGVAFGIGLPSNFLILITFLLLLVVGWGWWQVARISCSGQCLTKNQTAQLLAYSIILAGGISNLIDRLIWRGVRDWLPIPLTSLHNNLADWLIVIGCLTVATSLISSSRHAQPPTSSSSS